MPKDNEQSFYLNGRTYYPESLTIETWVGRHKDDFYDYDTYPAAKFLEMMVEAAKEDGRNAIREGIKKSLRIKG